MGKVQLNFMIYQITWNNLWLYSSWSNQSLAIVLALHPFAIIMT